VSVVESENVQNSIALKIVEAENLRNEIEQLKQKKESQEKIMKDEGKEHAMVLRDKKRENDEIMGKMKEEIRSLESMVVRLDKELDLKQGQKEVLSINKESQAGANKNGQAVAGTHLNFSKIEEDVPKINTNRENLPGVPVKYGERLGSVPVKHGERLGSVPVVKQSSIRELVSSSIARFPTFDDLMAVSELDTSNEI